MVQQRRDLLAAPSFWRLQGLDIDRILDATAVEIGSSGPIIGAMIVGGRSDAADMAIQRFGAASLIEAIESVAPEVSADHLVPWLRALRQRPADLAEALVRGVVRQRVLLVVLARAIDPDAVSNYHGDDPWALAVERSNGFLDDEAEDYLAAFLLSRGLGRRSREPERLMALSVQRVHAALAANRMPWAAWQLIQRCLPWVLPWREWDRCGRVRRAVVDRFIDSDLEPRRFGTMTDDSALWRDLVEAAAETGRGRRYLGRVRRRLREDADERWTERARHIEEVCG